LTLADCLTQASGPTPDKGKYSISGTELHSLSAKPLLLVDIDGVLSLWGFGMDGWPTDGAWHQIDGISHFLSGRAARHLQALCERYDPVWCSGWEEKADEHLPHLLGLPRFPHLSFDRNPGRGNSHWKLAAIDAYAGQRPLAWIDDAFNDACHTWAAERSAPTLLVRTAHTTGLDDDAAAELTAWADRLAGR
jgi:Swiss Army Knife RNA repair-like protein